MKKLIIFLIIFWLLPFFAPPALAKAPTKLVPHYYRIDNMDEFPAYRFFVVLWKAEPELVEIENAQPFGGYNEMVNSVIYGIGQEKYERSQVEQEIMDHRVFNEKKDLVRFSYPFSFKSWELPASSTVDKVTTVLKMADINDSAAMGRNKEYLVLQEQEEIIEHTNGKTQINRLEKSGQAENKPWWFSASWILLLVLLGLLFLLIRVIREKNK